MCRKGISVNEVQETKLNSRSDLLRYAGFNVNGKDLDRNNGGGPAFILHNTVQYRLIDGDINRSDTTREYYSIAIRSADAELEV